MKLSLAWLRDWVDFDGGPAEVAALLRPLGFDSSGWTVMGEPVTQVVTARVNKKEKHPGADRLSLCEVFDGQQVFRVVCGAPNVEAGGVYPFARVGARLPGGVEIKPAIIRGEASQGMLCSSRELGLPGEASGLMTLPSDTPLGLEVSQLLELGDAVLEIEVMPNRPDMLSHWGAARELAAALGKKMKVIDTGEIDRPLDRGAVTVEAEEACPFYGGYLVADITVKPSPLWMRLRLERCGIRSINNVVDITNYVLLDLGHPLHAFDQDKLAQGRLIVRRAQPGEKLLCLDGVERTLGDALVVADAEKPAALAGVMGGAASGVSAETTDIILESACFLASEVRRSRAGQNISTESSYRFERGVDIQVSRWAAARAARLLERWAGASVLRRLEVKRRLPRPLSLVLQPQRLNSLLGTSWPAPRMRQALERLNFQVSTFGQKWRVTPPPHRADVTEINDLAEEVGRSLGYDQLPASPYSQPPQEVTFSPERDWTLRARELWVGFGFQEAATTGLLSRSAWSDWGGEASSTVALLNPLSSEGEILAPSLLPLLGASADLNQRRGVSSVRLFEVARTFRPRGAAVEEKLSLAFLAMGEDHPLHFAHPPRPLDVWDLKGWVETFLSHCRLEGWHWSTENLPSFLHPKEGLAVVTPGGVRGCVGRRHPAQSEGRVIFVGELDMTGLVQDRATPLQARPVPAYPAVIRDFSLVFPSSVSWASVEASLRAETPWVEEVSLFDVFTGPPLLDDQRSLTFRVTFRRPDRTLTDPEALQAHQSIITGLQRRHGAFLRSGGEPSS